uniref:Kinase, CAMK CAMKL n=1 Tax=Trepomonas sp. PC1 TaxID=1076344 RepID=A0A146K8Z8_9EUKA|eukprot:JAP92036.1 Kinase, CAMK CAMKL [Trepomonas sp. PC1]
MQEETYKFLGNYKIGKKLGSGAFGEVRHSIHIPSGQSVAVKILNKDNIKTDTDFERIKREISILKQLNNEFVVKLLEVIDSPNHIYIFTEFVSNGQLFDLVLKSKLSEQRARELFQQICIGVHYCHERKICHRDLKLENILLTKDNKIKIIDFGLSNTLSTDYKLKTQCGSPHYASPELLLGKRYDGPALDIWAMGVILFTLVAGYQPFNNSDQKQLYIQIVNGKYQMPDGFSVPLQNLIRKMLVVDPEKRITMKQLADDEWLQLQIKFCQEEAKIDFRVIYQIVKAFNYNCQQCISYVRLKKHNSVTASYQLLKERQGKIEWDFELQKKYCKKMNLKLKENGEVEENSEDSDINLDLFDKK